MSIAKFGKRNEGNTGWEVVKEIPYVYQQELRREFIGERARTAGGNMRQDIVSVKRSWRIETRRMTYSEAYDLIDYLSSIFFSAGDFWLDEFGAESNTLTCYIPPEEIREERVTMSRDGTWHNDARELILTVIER